MDNKSLKKHLENYYVWSLDYDFSVIKHPIILIECVKSISGIDSCSFSVISRLWVMSS